MVHGTKSKVVALVLCGLGGVLAPGCGVLGGGGGGGGGAGGGANAFVGIDPQAMNNESLKASALAYYLVGEIASSSGVDANTDEATLEGLAAQDGPMAETTVANWLAMVDPSTIPTAGSIPRYDCTDKHQCPYSTACFNSGPWSQQSYRCWVTDCGSSKCSACPNWFPDTLKSLAFDSWCAYVCETQTYPPSPVAVGAVGMRNGTPFPATGAWCFNP